MRRSAVTTCRCLALVALAAVAGCPASAPPDRTPTQISAVSVADQSGTVGTAVGVLPSVKVANASEEPLEGITVTFTVIQGGGSIAGASAVTSATGIATLGGWTLGTVAGHNQVNASVAGMSGQAKFTASAAAGPPSKIVFTTAPPQSARHDDPLTAQPVVQLRDQFDNNAPKAGVAVTAAITAGGGSISGATATTDASGTATFTSLSLSGILGSRTLSFTAAGVPALSATVFLNAGTAKSLRVVGGDNQTATAGDPVVAPVNVAALDGAGNTVKGVPVVFAIGIGNGSLSAPSQVTGNDGAASPGTWTLGTTPGTNTLIATSPQLPGASATATATGTPRPDANP